VLVARQETSAPRRIVAEHVAPPAISLVAQDPAGTVPDLHGMTAREALRKVVSVGLSARLSGDGLVVSQTPEPGSPLEAGTTCYLVLDRGLPKRLAAIGQP
jgi:beta-lactam-binding protein with PASTA domain